MVKREESYQKLRLRARNGLTKSISRQGELSLHTQAEGQHGAGEGVCAYEGFSGYDSSERANKVGGSLVQYAYAEVETGRDGEFEIICGMYVNHYLFKVITNIIYDGFALLQFSFYF